MRRIGALWLKDGQKGKFMSGNIEIGDRKINILIFRNTRKKENRHPDYNIMIQEEQPRSPEGMKFEKKEGDYKETVDKFKELNNDNAIPF